MTTPEGQLRPPQPWTAADTCAVCKCTRTVTHSLYGGRRCSAHPDAYDPEIPVRLRLAGWSDTADAYRRYWETRSD